MISTKRTPTMPRIASAAGDMIRRPPPGSTTPQFGQVVAEAATSMPHWRQVVRSITVGGNVAAGWSGCNAARCPRLAMSVIKRGAAAWLAAAPPDFFQRLDVGGILEPAGSLGFDQIVEADQRDRNSLNVDDTAVRCGLFVFHLPRDREDVDSGVVADDGDGLFEYLGWVPFPRESIARTGERLEDTRGVRLGPLDQDVDIVSRARIAVEDAGDAADHEVLGVAPVQGGADRRYPRLC